VNTRARMYLGWIGMVCVLAAVALIGGCDWLGEYEDPDVDDGALLTGPTPPPAAVPRTGQTTSYMSLFHNDDGALRKGVAWPSPRFTDNLDGTVIDHLTGLVWLKDGSCLGSAFWATSLQFVDEFNRGKECNCEEYAASSYTDWRLPNVRELFSLIDFSQWSSYPNPMLPAEHPFLGVQRTEYWTSTSTGNLGPAYHVSFVGGYIDVDAKMHSHRIWAVRGGS
jgi:hypothetical protein